MRKLLSLILVLVLAASMAVVGGCSKTAETTAPQNAAPSFEGQTLNLYVAAGLKKPMDQVIDIFQKETGAKVVVNYNSSGALWAQINQGQPCDLYYSADWLYIEKSPAGRQSGKRPQIPE